MVRGLDFVGYHAIDKYTLEISIATTKSGWLARSWLTGWLGWGEKKYFDETEFRRDVLRLTLLYRVSGYLQARVDTVVRRSKDAVRIKFTITEGPPVRVRSIDITGTEGILPRRDLLHDIPLGVGDPFNRIRFEWAADTIRAEVRDRGYPFAEVFRSYDVNEDSLSARVRFEVDPGVRGRVDTVIVEGTREIAPGVVRRMIAVRPGDWFSQSALYRSQRDLYRLGVFGYVNVSLADSASEGAADSTVAVRVQVAEGKLRHIRAGVGYGTADCFRALTSWSASNVFGGGRVFDLTARVSRLGAGDPFPLGLEHGLCNDLEGDLGTPRFTMNYNVTATFQEPFFFSRLTRATLALSAEQHTEINAYLRRALSASVGFTRQTPWDIPVSVTYALSLDSTVAEPATFCSYLNVCSDTDIEVFQRQRVESVIGLGLVRDRSNSVLDPTRGSRIALEARYASRFLGSDSLIQFARGTVEATAYYPLGRHTTLAWRVRAGEIVSPALGFTGQSVEFIPPSERFYAGGANSVRGYGQNQLGPVVRVVDPARLDTTTIKAADNVTDSTVIGPDTVTTAKGGNSLLIANAELRFPLPGFAGRLTGALFVDLGQLFERGGELLHFSEARITPGAGIRITTPLGPMRFDVAYNGYPPERGELYVKQDTKLLLIDRDYPQGVAARKHLQFHFSVGQAF